MIKQTESNFIEKTRAFKTIQAKKDAATKAGLSLDYSKDSEDLPNSEMVQLEKLKELAAKGNGKMNIVVTKIGRQLFHTVDKNGKPITKEMLTYGGEVRIVDHRGVPYRQEFEVGKYLSPNIVTNTNQRWNPETGQPLNPEKILSGQKLVYDIELPKDAGKRKKTIDDVIGDNHPESIQYYYYELLYNNTVNKRDATFSYSDFVNCSIEELQNMSAKGGGSKNPGYYRRDGKLYDKDGNQIG
jgi:hypothetical protein